MLDVILLLLNISTVNVKMPLKVTPSKITVSPLAVL